MRDNYNSIFFLRMFDVLLEGYVAVERDKNNNN